MSCVLSIHALIVTPLLCWWGQYSSGRSVGRAGWLFVCLLMTWFWGRVFRLLLLLSYGNKEVFRVNAGKSVAREDALSTLMISLESSFFLPWSVEEKMDRKSSNLVFYFMLLLLLSIPLFVCVEVNVNTIIETKWITIPNRIKKV